MLAGLTFGDKSALEQEHLAEARASKEKGRQQKKKQKKVSLYSQLVDRTSNNMSSTVTRDNRSQREDLKSSCSLKLTAADCHPAGENQEAHEGNLQKAKSKDSQLRSAHHSRLGNGS